MVLPRGVLVERLAGGLVSRSAPRELLPPAHGDIDKDGVELDPVADPAGHLGGDHAAARAEKRVVDRLAGAAVVDDRATHALDRLLGGILPAVILPAVAEPVVVADFPDRRLLPVALPMAGPAGVHRVLRIMGSTSALLRTHVAASIVKRLVL